MCSIEDQSCLPCMDNYLILNRLKLPVHLWISLSLKYDLVFLMDMHCDGRGKEKQTKNMIKILLKYHFCHNNEMKQNETICTEKMGEI